MVIRRETGAVLLHEMEGRTLTVPLVIELDYDPARPWAVAAVFHGGPDEPVRWEFSRDVLWSGMTAATGEGDVRISPEEEQGWGIRMDITSPFGEASFLLPKQCVKSFLDRTFEAVPQGLESIDWDRELAALLEGEDG